MFPRFWSLLDDDDAPVRRAKVAAFQTIFVLVLAVEYWIRAFAKWGQLSPLYSASLGVVTVLAACVLAGLGRRLAFGALAVTQAVIVWREFPATGNHAYLELVFCVLCAALDRERDDDRVLFLRAVRWSVCVVLFYSGVQKIVHGYWFRGEYLAFSSHTPSFRAVLALLVEPAEMQRLLALHGEVGDGPYRMSSPLLLAASNSVYLLEMALGALLLWPRTRRFAVPVVLAMLVAIEVGAREAFFGLVFVNAVLVFVRTDLNRRLIPAFGVLLLAMLLSRVGILPEATFY
jgi:hypothetical protein